jgi:hypothetical protein
MSETQDNLIHIIALKDNRIYDLNKEVKNLRKILREEREEHYKVHKLMEKYENVLRQGEVKFTDTELEIIKTWGFIASTENPLSEKEVDLYKKVTNVK